MPDVSQLRTANLCRSSKKKRAEAEKKKNRRPMPKSHEHLRYTYVSEQRMGRTIPYAYLIGRYRPLI